MKKVLLLLLAATTIISCVKKSDYEDLQIELADTEATLNAQNRVNATLAETISSLEGQIGTLSSLNSGLNSELNAVSNELASVKTDLGIAGAENDALIQRVADLEVIIDELEATQVHAIEAKIELLEDDLADAQKVIDVYKSDSYQADKKAEEWQDVLDEAGKVATAETALDVQKARSAKYLVDIAALQLQVENGEDKSGQLADEIAAYDYHIVNDLANAQNTYDAAVVLYDKAVINHEVAVVAYGIGLAELQVIYDAIATEIAAWEVKRKAVLALLVL